MLIDQGELPEGMAIENLPVDFPILREREPDLLKRELGKMRDSQEKALHRLDHHRDRISRMDESDFADRMERIKNEEIQSAGHIFSTEAGMMPMYRVLAFVEKVLQEGWGDEYDKNLFFDFHASVTSDLHKQQYELMEEERALNRKEDGYDQKLRAVKRKQEKLYEGLVRKLSEWLDEDERYTAALGSEGASNGQLLLTSDGSE